MPIIINISQKTTDDGIIEVKELDNGIKIETPIELSETYLQWLSYQQQAEDDQRLVNSLIPSQDDIDQAEFELKSINLLMEVGLL